MGSGSFGASEWKRYASSVADHGAEKIYASRSAKKEFVPEEIKVREAFDSDEHPESTPIIIALDVTGSMERVLETAAKRIGDMFLDMLDRKTISHPQIASMAIGDVTVGDRSPLQFTQFESDNRCVEQLTGLYFEHGGGSNDNESYSLAWITAAYLTDCDAFKKRGKKGYLFTIGDEMPTEKLTEKHVRRVFPNSELVPCPQGGIDAETALQLAEEKWHCFHLVVKEGYFPTRHGMEHVMKAWTHLMGQNAIPLDDITKLAEVITSIIEVNEGRSVDDVVGSWDGDTSLVVRNAVSNIVPTAAAGSGTGIVPL